MQELKSVPLQNIYRLFNVGGTSLVSAACDGETDVMPATWVMPVSADPALVTVCVDRTHFTRSLIDRSRMFALSLPTLGIAREVLALGSISKNDDPKKLEKSGARFFTLADFNMPLVEGCACYVFFKALDEPHIAEAYDLFIGKAVAAWADPRIFDGCHWLFENAPKEMSTLHYVAGGHCYGIGQVLDIPGFDHIG